MIKLLKKVSLLMVVALLVSLLGCTTQTATFKIGALGPLTGESSIGGLDEKDGKTLAVEDFNKAGGWNGQKAELVFEDDASQPSQSASAAMKLINTDKVVAIVGAHNSSCTLAVMEIAANSKIPMITPGSSSPAVTSSGNAWITRSFPPDPQQAFAVVRYAKEKLGAKKLGIIYVNDDFGVGGLKSVTNAAEKLGVTLVSESFMGEDKDMRSPITKLRDAGVDGLVIWSQYLPGSLIMKQAREMGWNVQFYGASGIIHNKTWELSSGYYVGTINAVPFIPNVDDAKKQEWVKRYEERFNKKPSQNSARAYDATTMLLNAIKAANSLDPVKINDALRNTKNYDGLQGKISIDPATGEYIGEVMIVKVSETPGIWNFLESVSSY